MSEKIMRENLFVVAQAYATAKGLALTTVSKQIHGNQHFLSKYIAGEISVQVQTYWLIVDRLRESFPTNASWPDTLDVPRLSRVPREPSDPPLRGPGGKFLGKKVHKSGARG